MKKNRVYLDNCCLNRPFDDQNNAKIKLETAAKLEIQNRIKEGKLELAWSYILDFENSRNPEPERIKAIFRWKKLCIIDIEESDDIILEANRLKTFGLSLYDALHVACAIKAQCEYFYTTDKKILNKQTFISNIVIANPVLFILDKG